MIYNDNLLKSYGAFNEIRGISNLVQTRPSPSDQDYKAGYINRYFAKKVNENRIIEVDYNSTTTINTALYKVVKVAWKITGPRTNVMKNGTMDKAGVVDQNKFEIEKIYKEEDVDLSGVLTNLTEYWRGS
jgi:hypothetical protein